MNIDRLNTDRLKKLENRIEDLQRKKQTGSIFDDGYSMEKKSGEIDKQIDELIQEYNNEVAAIKKDRYNEKFCNFQKEAFDIKRELYGNEKLNVGAKWIVKRQQKDNERWKKALYIVLGIIVFLAVFGNFFSRFLMMGVLHLLGAK